MARWKSFVLLKPDSGLLWMGGCNVVLTLNSPITYYYVDTLPMQTSYDTLLQLTTVHR